MWGYIVKKDPETTWTSVPSLYVRVYRGTGYWFAAKNSSLIICEGISAFWAFVIYSRLFPHYMWGYIEICKRHGLEIEVPSLYVRVYRTHGQNGNDVDGSLIICEGISFAYCIIIFAEMFPHYMWGYIAGTPGTVILCQVPSLYVRVYRICWTYFDFWKCSIITCEGISV